MVKPVTVTVTAVLAAIAGVAVVMTIWVRVGAALVPAAPLGAMEPTAGVADVAKKPDGYVRVMLLPAASAPPAEVVKMNVAAAAVLLATR